MVAREHGNIHRSGELDARRRWCGCSSAATRFASRERFAQVLLACECDARGRLGLEDRPYPQRERLLAALAAAQSVETEPIARAAQQAGAAGAKIGEAIARARVSAVAATLPATA